MGRRICGAHLSDRHLSDRHLCVLYYMYMYIGNVYNIKSDLVLYIQGDWTYRGMQLLTASEDLVPRINLKIAVASGPPYVMAGSHAGIDCGARGLDRRPASGRTRHQ